MTGEAQGGHRGRRRFRLIVAVLTVIVVAVVLVPPLVSISRYKSQITQLISQSLGGPVRLSSVELRLLPRPGFVITDLSVAEDPAYGAEPVLHANTVTASIRLLSLWRGRLEIGRISVDEASLNLVRTAPGRWNLDPLFRTAAARAGAMGSAGARRPVPLPYLEATNSRINIRNGLEKLPFSLLNTDLSFWQANPGDWRLQLRGQPARTDVSMNEEDTGVLRMEASMRSAPVLNEVPVRLDLDWREAQLGQLARLITGSDAGWRGDLTGELHLEGTAADARVQARLRAAGVHRVEFSPAEPLDFDANCNLVYHFSRRAVEGLVCDSPLGDGRFHLTGEVADADGPPRLSAELDRVPVAAGLALLRAMRSGLPPDLQAKGTLNGKIAYADVPAASEPVKPVRARRGRQAKPAPAEGPLTGSLTVEDFALSGSGLSQPVQAAKVVLAPVADASPAGGQKQALAGTMNIPAGGAGPLVVAFRIERQGYQVALRGQVSVARARELERAAGLPDSAGLDGLAGDPIAIDLIAAGPWLQAPEATEAFSSPADGQVGAAAAPVNAENEDSLTGTVTLRNANWKADYLAGHVQIQQATLHLGTGPMRWDPVFFTYGPLKGTGSLTVPLNCQTPTPCEPHFEIQFGALDAATLQTAILGVPQKATLLSNLFDRLHPASAPPWPEIKGTVKADSLILGPVTLLEPAATVSVDSTGAQFTDLDAGLLGGKVEVSGTLEKAASDQAKPGYTLEGHFENLSARAVGELIGQSWSGGVLNADGKIQAVGYTDKDLAGTAKGMLHFEWLHGTIATRNSEAHHAGIPAAMTRFDRWTAETAIGDGAITLGTNTMAVGSRTLAAEGSVVFGDPPKVIFRTAKQPPPRKP